LKPQTKPVEPSPKPADETPTKTTPEKPEKQEKQPKKPPERPQRPEKHVPTEPEKPVETKPETAEVPKEPAPAKAEGAGEKDNEDGGKQGEEGEPAKEEGEDKPKPQPKAPPKFGVGLPMGPMGGDLLAEMKKRSERSNSGSKVSTPLNDKVIFLGGGIVTHK
jgi:hypothetical protein